MYMQHVSPAAGKPRLNEPTKVGERIKDRQNIKQKQSQIMSSSKAHPCVHLDLVLLTFW
jgi:hypothetical protein